MEWYKCAACIKISNEDNISKNSSLSLQDLLKIALESLSKRMLIVLLSDLEGLTSLDSKLLEEQKRQKLLLLKTLVLIRIRWLL